MQDLDTLLLRSCIMPFYPNFTQICPKFLACLCIWFLQTQFCFATLSEMFFFIAELIMLLHLFPHCLLFMLMTQCLFPVFALLMVRASTCRLVIVFSPHLHFNAHWCKPSSVALALPSTREAGLQCERSSKCGFWSLPFPTNGFLF